MRAASNRLGTTPSTTCGKTWEQHHFDVQHGLCDNCIGQNAMALISHLGDWLKLSCGVLIASSSVPKQQGPWHNTGIAIPLSAACHCAVIRHVSKVTKLHVVAIALHQPSLGTSCGADSHRCHTHALSVPVATAFWVYSAAAGFANPSQGNGELPQSLKGLDVASPNKQISMLRPSDI